MMRRACVACEAPLPTNPTLTTREMMFGLKDPFRYSACPDCGSLTLIDPPSDWSRYYPPGAYYSIGASSVLYSPSWRRRLKTDMFLRVPPSVVTMSGKLWKSGRLASPVWYWWFHSMHLSRSSRLLDVGSGTGALLHKLAADGFLSLTGVDPFIARSESYSDGVRIVKGQVEDLTGPFDVIMFHHSLEHTDDPDRHLKVARALLAPGGVVVIRIPVADSWAYRYYGPDWVQLDPPRHQIIMTSQAVFRLADQCGFEVLRAYRDSESGQIWGSELYRRDIRLQGADPSEHFSPALLRTFADRAKELNASNEGDQSVYLLGCSH
jgi:SAM-dependent methyltransferase